jgi:long-chain acyl-CoA synthetase
VTNTCDFLLARARPGDVAIVEVANRSFTYRQLHEAVAALAAELAGAGLPAGSRVGLVGPNSFFWVASYLAVLKLGHVAVPLSERNGSAELRRRVDQVGCAAAFLDRRVPGDVAAVLAAVPVITDEALRALPGVPPPSRGCDPHADAVLMFTSGTTAQPKVVRVTHANIQANTESICGFLELRSTDRILVVLPFSYCYGASLLHTHLREGASLVLSDSVAFPQTVVDLIETHGCTELAGVPSSYQLLLRASTFASRPLPSLRLLQQAGGKMAPEIIERLLAAQPSARLYVMYGQTEATARLAYVPPDRLPQKLGSIGTAIPGVELCVLDEEGRPVGPGQRGEIYARGPSISPGYLDDPEGTAEKFTPLGLRTGDVAVIDADGFLSVVDRMDDFIKSWGHRISSHEIEECALQLRGLDAAAAVGVADLEAGEAITLFVTPASSASVTAHDVIEHCRRHLPRHKVPKRVVLVESMPLNTHGKVAKRRLRDLAEHEVATAAFGR